MSSKVDTPLEDLAPGVPMRERRRSVSLTTALPVTIYAVLGFAAYLPAWPGDPDRISQCTCSDPGLNAWFLAFTAHAIAHGQNLFFTTAINWPHGANLTYNAQMPLLGLLAAPLTLTAGPIASLNLLMWLAFPLSASSMFLVLRRWTSWWPAAFAGGLFYGFSPYMVGQSGAHLHLIFVPLPPLIMLAVVELFVRRSGNPRRWGLVLGLAVAGQFLISSEVLFTGGLVAVLSLIILGVGNPAQVGPSLRFAGAGLALAAVVVGVALAYPVAEFFAGRLHYTAASGTSAALGLRADLLGPIIPTSFERLAPAALKRHGDTLTVFGNYAENGSYLGIPLVAFLAYVGIRFWRSRWIRFASAMVLATFVLSLGSPLQVNGFTTVVRLPDALLARLPLLNQIIPSRIALFTTVFVSVMAALGIDQIRSATRANRASTRPRHGHGGQSRSSGPIHVGVALLAVVAILATLIPRWPNTTVSTAIPTYFTSNAVNRIPPGTVALTYPYPAPLFAQPMVWQSVTGMRFSLIGGYLLVPTGSGTLTLFPSELAPLDVQRFFINEAGGIALDRSPVVPDDRALVGDVRHFIVRYGVGVIIVDRKTRNAVTVEALIRRTLEMPPVVDGGTDAWYQVQKAPGISGSDHPEPATG